MRTTLGEDAMKPQKSMRRDKSLSDWISSGRDRYLGADADRAVKEAAERQAAFRPVSGYSGAYRVKFGA